MFNGIRILTFPKSQDKKIILPDEKLKSQGDILRRCTSSDRQDVHLHADKMYIFIVARCTSSENIFL